MLVVEVRLTPVINPYVNALGAVLYHTEIEPVAAVIERVKKLPNEGEFVEKLLAEPYTTCIA